MRFMYNNHLKKLFNKKKKSLLILVTLFIILFSSGIMIAYAFYHNNMTFPILANQVGDFDGPRGDMSISVYKQSNELSALTKEYNKTYSVPKIGFAFDRADCSIPCTEEQNAACHYTYNINNNTFSLTSNKKVSCKFYFNKTSDSDINVYIMVEDQNGGNVYNGKNYRLYDSIPAYGYEYASSSCANPATVTFNQELKTFNVSTLTKNNCYAYFNKTGEADVTVNVFAQSEVNSNVYTKVSSIPTDKAYLLSAKPDFVSACYDLNGIKTAETVAYSGGYVTLSASGKRNCNVYLDLYNGAPLIEKFDAVINPFSLQLNATVKPGLSPVNCYKFKIDNVTEYTTCQTTPNYTYNDLNECTYYKIIIYAIDDSGAGVGYTKTFKTKCV